MNVVWFKRDLRIDDHRPLVEAAQSGDCLPVYIIEPEYWGLPDTSNRQWQFIAQSLKDLHRALCQLGQGLWVLEGDAVEVLSWLDDQFGIDSLYSHEETGNHWTFMRDISVHKWAKEHDVEWKEFPQFAVKRVLTSRDHWSHHWKQQILSDCYEAPPQISCPSVSSKSYYDEAKLDLLRGYDQSPCDAQMGGIQEAQLVLDDFLHNRGQFYRGGISKPAIASEYCSRLSPYITYGCLSLRRVVQMTHQAQVANKGVQRWPASLAAFESRLHWHCHFIQKLEDQPNIEKQCMHPGFEGMRDQHFTAEQKMYFSAWASGNTGYPLVDACMRMLIRTGWLNFRMRAMLVSFASYHLWLHWEQTALHLARLFVDYEPGIHYSQIQMQSGTTGINPPRIYNPLKQSLEKDEHGEFIRRWCPTLSSLPDCLIHNPWLMTEVEQEDYGIQLGKDYPLPIVDLQEAGKSARQQYSAWKREHIDKEDTEAVIKKHASRKRTSKQAQKQQLQIDLFN